MIRAVLLASATATSLSGFRAINPVSHAGNATPRFACLMIDEAPTTSRVLNWRLPCLEIDPSFSFPPLESRRGVTQTKRPPANPGRFTLRSLSHAYRCTGAPKSICFRRD